MKNFNQQYLNIVKKVLEEGEYTSARNAKTLQVFCPGNIEVDLRQEFPILSVRKIPFYKAALETLFFLSGNSSYDSMPKSLVETWWKPWASQAEKQNSWGNFYGHQWRHQTTEKGNSFDAWETIIDELCTVIKTGIINRKMVVSLWRKPDCDSKYTYKPSVLDACHSTCLVFNLVPKYSEEELMSGCVQHWQLDLHHTQRSLDLMCGTGSDLIYSGLIMHILCSIVKEALYNPDKPIFVYPRKLIFSPSNTHIYEPHIAQAKQLLLLNSTLDTWAQAKVSVGGPLIDFSQFKTIENVKEAVSLINYKPNWGNYNFELIG